MEIKLSKKSPPTTGTVSISADEMSMVGVSRPQPPEDPLYIHIYIGVFQRLGRRQSMNVCITFFSSHDRFYVQF